MSTAAMTQTVNDTASKESAYLARLNANMKKIFDATKLQIDNLKDGEKISIKELTEKVSHFLDMSPTRCCTFVSMYAHNYSTVQQGRNGGVYRVAPIKPSIPCCPECGQKLRARAVTAAEAKVSVP